MKPDDVTRNPRVAGLVKRYHTWPVLHQQNIAEHSWQVWRIYKELYGIPSAEVTNFIMCHDMGELVAGDLPYPNKKDNPNLKFIIDAIEFRAVVDLGHGSMPTLSHDDKLRISVCHLMEMWEYGMHDYVLGNRFGKVVMNRCGLALSELLRANPSETEVVTEHWKKMKKLYAIA